MIGFGQTVWTTHQTNSSDNISSFQLDLNRVSSFLLVQIVRLPQLVPSSRHTLNPIRAVQPVDNEV
jgi:hypothetical protein